MTTTIYNNDGKPVAKSRNLRAMLRGASLYGGVRGLFIGNCHNGAVLPDGAAEVTAFYANGYTGKTVFSSFLHAVEWANKRSSSSPRVSWFAGCTITVSSSSVKEA